MVLHLRSPAVPPHGEISVRHPCAGEDMARALEWAGLPEGGAVEQAMHGRVLAQVELVGTYRKRQR